MSVLNHTYRWTGNFLATTGRACAMLFTALILTGMQQAPQDNERENQLKAVFLYNFTQFVEWPSSAFSTPDSPFIIGVLGKNPLGTYLEEVSEGETASGHPIMIKYYSSVIPEISTCQILFINKTFRDVEQATQLAKGKPILTVSDHENFMKRAGMLRFFVQEGKIRFEINTDVSSSSGLIISSKLMRVATVYQE